MPYCLIRMTMGFMLFLCLAQNIITPAYAANLGLTLTPTEMQRLKHLFPTDDTDTKESPELTHVIWKGDPFTIQLPLHHEKRLHFQQPISIDLKGGLQTNQVRIINNNQSLYVTALQPFAKVRAYVTLKTTGEVILMDWAADTESSAISNKTVFIDSTNQNKDVNRNENDDNALENSRYHYTKSIHRDIDFIAFIRFAWQSLYASDRLIINKSRFTRVPMHTHRFISDLVYGDKIIAHPISSWRSSGYYVTAILLKNKYPIKTTVQVNKDLCGNWLAATLYPSSTFSRGDASVLFLVSPYSFTDTIGICHGHSSH